MKTVKENIENEIIINKSRFITLLIKINNPDEIEKNLKEIKKKYKDATHYCYAYIIGNKEKCSDNGETTKIPECSRIHPGLSELPPDPSPAAHVC